MHHSTKPNAGEKLTSGGNVDKLPTLSCGY
uniref:Uncharacterized protein n=1 Tax=Anguilla anguilla TaxID=7936 RepID=A0A0E9XKN7_ANGAN